MASVKLGKRPETFKPFPVSFEMPDGSPAVITATFKYRTRSEFGALLDAMRVNAEGDVDPNKELKFEDLFRGAGKANAKHLLDSLAAWDVEDQPLTLEGLELLCDTVPAGAGALMRAYSAACQEGRLGN